MEHTWQITITTKPLNSTAKAITQRAWSIQRVLSGRRHKDSLGLDCRDDNGAIAKAKFIATQIAIDTPQLNHRHVAVMNDAGDEIFEAPIRYKPPVS